MAISRPSSDDRSRYNPKQDFTADQLHRFGEVANEANKRREDQVKQTLIHKAKKTAMKSVLTSSKHNDKSVRNAIWLIVLLAVLLWMMYMFN
ncbi:hypothetical protein DZ860_11545 [Vibrio sinensis]|uniref:Uncharacterized protein n=1 Tax=Vibrio sinensis TaxID=2302434 RepID=A0A3A6QSC2_9VIBR|nr:hypothetical protein [Vibrio sinensis]RJX70961.1 hypothetical protein DZ860_11545 [Vibrio sinensis]